MVRTPASHPRRAPSSRPAPVLAPGRVVSLGYAGDQRPAPAPLALRRWACPRSRCRRRRDHAHRWLYRERSVHSGRRSDSGRTAPREVMRTPPGTTSRGIADRQRSDALVFFGATGDLAHKEVFPALQGLVEQRRLDIPVIGVARSGWDLERLRARARDSLEQHGGVNPDAFAKLSSLLRYIDGDYRDPATFTRLRQALGDAKRPLHYLAIPPSMFATVTKGLAASGSARGARLVVEKPFGRDLASAGN